MAFTALLILVSLLAEKPVTAEQGTVCNDKFLVTATNTESGVEVRIFSPGDKEGSSYVRKDISRHLSPECGEDYFRCGEPLIVDYTAPSTEQEPQHLEHVVVLPLTNAIGLLKLKLNSNHMLSVSNDYTIDLSEQNCSPTAVYHIGNSYYAVCLNTETDYITLLELRLNVTVLEESYVRDEREQLPHLSNITNFVYVYLYEHFIFYAAGYHMVALRPIQNTFQSWDIELEKKNCYVASLAYIADEEMLAFCNNKQAVYVDLNRESIFASVNYTTDGQPFVCPNPDVYLSVYPAAKYVQYGLRSDNQVKNFEIPMLQFDNGVCLGSHNRTLFAYTDRDTGVHLLEAPEGTLTTLSTTSCINYPCQRLVLLGDRYLVIREKRGASWFITVFDSLKENFPTVMEVQHSQADLMAIVQDVGACREPPSNGTNQQQATSSSNSPNMKRNIVIIAICATIVVVLVVVVLVVVGILIVVRYKRCKQNRKNDSEIPVQENEKRTDTTQFVAGSAAMKGKEELEMGAEPLRDKSQCRSSPESDSSNGLRNSEELAQTQELPIPEERAAAEAKKKKKGKYTKEKSPEADSLLNN